MHPARIRGWHRDPVVGSAKVILGIGGSSRAELQKAEDQDTAAVGLRRRSGGKSDIALKIRVERSVQGRTKSVVSVVNLELIIGAGKIVRDLQGSRSRLQRHRDRQNVAAQSRLEEVVVPRRAAREAQAADRDRNAVAGILGGESGAVAVGGQAHAACVSGDDA